MPREAVTIAYAPAMQESKLHNLDYGTATRSGSSSSGPRRAGGRRGQLENPVYATTKFFAALNPVHGYPTMPVSEAAQAVQHSADGSAYMQ